MSLRSVVEDFSDKPHRKAVRSKAIYWRFVYVVVARRVGVGRLLMCVTFGVLVCLVCLRVSRLNSNLTVITRSLTEDVFID